MPKVHIKGRLLQLLEQGGPQWDYEVAAKIASEYDEVEGQYWYDTIRLNLADLFSSGLITEVEETLDPSKSYGVEKVLFRFELTDFGRERMRDTGLSTTTARRAA
jgi:hypothetical protein